jgi:hypothetical protein
MLYITIPQTEWFDEKNQIFMTTREQKIQLEHSLVSLKKWESKWKKPFLDNNKKTKEEIKDYIRCMTITQNVDPNIYYAITDEIILQISDYINDPMTATTINERPGRTSRSIITAEIIYYWMISFNIPFECQKWHLNSLLTLIKVCSIKQQPNKKMSKRDIYNRNRALNNSRKAKLNTRG